MHRPLEHFRIRWMVRFVVFVGAASLLVGAPSASAHTEVVDTIPDEAATVADADTVAVTFRHAVVGVPEVDVTGPGGDATGGSATLVAGDTVVRQPLAPDLAAGTYTVIVAFVAQDGDAQSFSYTFDLDPTAAPGGSASDGDDGLLLSIDLDVVRLWVHVVAASVWVGGQLVLGGLVGTLRRIGPDAPGIVARRFGRIAWTALAVAVVTGVWNLLDVGLGDRSSAYHATLGLKLGLVGISAAGALIHAQANGKRALAIGGAVGLLGALAAMLLGVALGHGS